MAKTKITDKQKYGFLTAAQASQVLASIKFDIDKLIMTGDKPREKFSLTNLVLDPQLWPRLAELLLMSGKSDGTKLDFGKVAEHFNGVIKVASAGMTPEPKPLNGGEMRKLAMVLTRKRLADANDVLAKTPDDVEALAKQKEAKSIFAKQGWAETAVKRETKATGKAGKAPKPTPDAKLVQDPKAQVEKCNIPPVESAPTSKPDLAEPNRYYVTGNTKPVKDDLKKFGGQYDPTKTQWWFRSVEAQARGQKIVDDYQAGTK